MRWLERSWLRHKPGEAEKAVKSPAVRRWLKSAPPHGDAFVDTGLSRPTDSQKLRWSPSEEDRKAIRELMKESANDVKKLFEEGNPEAEAKRLNDLVAPVLKAINLDPRRFGVSMPDTPIDGGR